MKLPSLVRRKPLTDIAAEGVALQARAEAIAVEIGRLDAARPDLILDGEPDDVAAHDASRSRLAIELEQASARLGRLDGERHQAEAEAEQERRRKLYAAAKKARSEGIAALAEYERHAKAAAAALFKLVDVEHLIASANDDDQLPDGAEPIPPAEPDNSIPPTPDRYSAPQLSTPTITRGSRTDAIAEPHMTPRFTICGAPGQAHISILRLVRIPGLRRGEMLFPLNPGSSR